MSERQGDALTAYNRIRDSILPSFVDTTNGIPNNFLELITNYRLYGLIPQLLKQYRKKPYISNLTALVILMAEAKYEPFLNSGIYKRLYTENTNKYRNGMDVTPSIAKHITALARQFYEEREGRK